MLHVLFWHALRTESSARKKNRTGEDDETRERMPGTSGCDYCFGLAEPRYVRGFPAILCLGFMFPPLLSAF